MSPTKGVGARGLAIDQWWMGKGAGRLPRQVRTGDAPVTGRSYWGIALEAMVPSAVTTQYE